MGQRMFLATVVALVCVPGLHAATAGPVGDWVAYRDAYRAMVVFEKYGGAKSLLQQHLQVVPRAFEGDASALQLVVAGNTSHGHFPLDATLRTVFPLTRAAYQDNAVLQLSRPLGPFTVRPQVSIALRPDNVYDSHTLRHGCEQALAYARQLALLGPRRCSGVRFVFGKGSAALPVLVRGMPGVAGVAGVANVAGVVSASDLRLAAAPAAPFAGDGDASFPVVTYRFPVGAERLQLSTTSTPLAITPLFD